MADRAGAGDDEGAGGLPGDRLRRLAQHLESHPLRAALLTGVAIAAADALSLDGRRAGERFAGALFVLLMWPLPVYLFLRRWAWPTRITIASLWVLAVVAFAAAVDRTVDRETAVSILFALVWAGFALGAGWVGDRFWVHLPPPGPRAR